MRRAALIYNPRSGRQRHARALDAILAALREGGFAAEPVPTAFAGEATALARDVSGEAEVVFAFGGDGTVREVACGLLGSPAALGILPGGTTNVLARALGLPADPVAAASVLGRLTARPLDVGLASGQPFLMMVSAGLDASVLGALSTRLKWRFGKSAIVYQGLREWWRYSYPQLAITADGETLGATFAAVSNIPNYGGAFRLAPDARPDDGWLDLLLFRGTGRATTLAFALDLLRSAHVRRRDVEIRRVREVVFAQPAGAPAQVDGDLCQERLPLTVRLAPERLLILAPALQGGDKADLPRI
ncbi:MAG TPA: diacylglycerol kinase family protein [Thermoanaerobaculia bacterium]|jgi:YegS/Rv2252/BmrU family lipid kinase|nr:diacylglycerol kinase family protein [Thermoanaerobaculia bacterium]